MDATANEIQVQHALAFRTHELQLIQQDGHAWMSSAQLSRALEYTEDKYVRQIYQRHTDEFTDMMTRVLKVNTPGGVQAVRFFTLRGAHMVAMFARTPVAKEFRAWVLDILDRETKRPGPSREEVLTEALEYGRWMMTVRDGRIMLKPVPDDALVVTSEGMADALRDPCMVPIRHLPKIISAATDRFNGWAMEQYGKVHS